MKTKLFSALLAVLMMVCLVAPASASYYVPVDNDNTIAPPCPSVPLEPETVIVDCSGVDPYIHVIWWDETVVTMNRQFLVDFTTDSPVKSWRIASEEGYTPLAREIVTWLVDTGMAYVDSSGFVYGDDVIFVDATWRLTTEEAIACATGAEIETAYQGEVALEVDYGSYLHFSDMWVYHYAETASTIGPDTDSIFDAPIWAVRDIDGQKLEVYTRDGFIVTLDRSTVARWAISRDYFQAAGCGSSDGKFDGNPHLYLDPVVDILNALVDGIWTNPMTDLTNGEFMPDVMESAYLSRVPIIDERLETAKDESTTASFSMVFEFGDSVWAFPVSFSFIQQDENGEFYLCPLLSGDDFEYCVTNPVYLTDDDILDIVILYSGPGPDDEWDPCNEVLIDIDWTDQCWETAAEMHPPIDEEFIPDGSECEIELPEVGPVEVN